MSRSPSESSRDFNVRSWQVLSHAERAERESQQGKPHYRPPSDCYDGKELQRTPGIPDARFRAFELPSRAHGQLNYPNGTRIPFPEPADDTAR
ncbi:hypothetical protein N5D77_18195 [Comamonas thiooxydans]|uniref:Uncharacterized protein n=1 Tax=Comamonas thiooxydans TaxID=363952 RepID=A0AA42Q4Z1_9BURK|nr:hypothetical protein [Comamonas thiooxydans]MDH1335841.1 hypothetical protein [Comamonas thiooxydans]MDH1743603.1 hypothetical protein [Comamonas thiooxydans]MDH1788504.1 hypothetical protein [Comamonas thiooxydans]